MILSSMTLPQTRSARAIVRRTRGRRHGPVTRLISRSDLLLRLRGQEKFWRNLEVVSQFKYERLAQSALAIYKSRQM